jgi:hypothetical protein
MSGTMVHAWQHFRNSPVFHPVARLCCDSISLGLSFQRVDGGETVCTCRHFPGVGESAHNNLRQKIGLPKGGVGGQLTPMPYHSLLLMHCSKESLTSPQLVDISLE